MYDSGITDFIFIFIFLLKNFLKKIICFFGVNYVPSAIFDYFVLLRGVLSPSQAQQLFQRDAQTITPEALESVKAALASGDGEHKVESKKKAIPRKAAGQTWEDPTLAEWPESVCTILQSRQYMFVAINCCDCDGSEFWYI